MTSFLMYPGELAKAYAGLMGWNRYASALDLSSEFGDYIRTK